MERINRNRSKKSNWNVMLGLIVAGFAFCFAANANYKPPLSFEKNQGQTNAQVKFLTRGQGHTLFFTATEAVMVLRHSQGITKNMPPPHEEHRKTIKQGESDTLGAIVLRMKFVGANPVSNVTGRKKLSGKSHYFIGNDSKNWHTDVSNFEQVWYEGVYPGIDLKYYGIQEKLEYDLIVAPGADPDVIRLAFEGADKLEIDDHGDLILYVGGGKIRQHKPVVYQKEDGLKRKISGHYVLQGTHGVRFQVSAYDASKPLIIDPVLSYSTYLGGSEDDEGASVAVDNAGHAYVIGKTMSSNYPTTAGVIQPTFGGVGPSRSTGDVFVAKLNPTGSALVYSTYLGGDENDVGVSIAVDDTGNAYVTGRTDSDNFPTTPGAAQAAINGISDPIFGFHNDAFVAKLKPDGTALIYSTYLGGNFDDGGTGIALDASDHAYVTGWTSSDDFPTTPGAFQTVFAEGGFVTKLNPAGTALNYSTYLGSGVGTGIDVDATGSAYVSGQTEGGFPTTPGAFQSVFGGFSDAFVAKFNATGSALDYATYLGGSNEDSWPNIAVDGSGRAHVAGSTWSTDFPTTVGSVQTTHGGGTCTEGPGFTRPCTDVFVTKLNATGTAADYSTYLGSVEEDLGQSIAIDTSGNVYVTGRTAGGFPVTPDAIQPSLGGASDAFIFKMNSSGSMLDYSSYLGGSSYDAGHGVAVDLADNIYVTGVTTSTGVNVFPPGSGDLPTVNPLQPIFGGGWRDAFVAKISTAEINRFEYAAKIVCGAQQDKKDMRLARGFYATEISVHNPNYANVKFFKKLALTFPPVAQKPGEVIPIAEDKLEPDEALKVDCNEIQRKFFPAGFPMQYITGYIIIQSPTSLDVSAVYTAATIDKRGRAVNHSSIDIEQIRERQKQR